jgi:hypothetical protein
VNDRVFAVAVFDDGDGECLFAAGRFTFTGGLSTNLISKWDGSTWSSLGTGFDSDANALAVFDDGSGEALYVGGTFVNAGAVSANRIAKWDGSVWSSLGSGLNSNVYSLEEHDDGAGAALFVGGRFKTISESGDSHLAKWGVAASPALSSDDTSISLASGGQQLLALDGGAAQVGWVYFVFGSVTGTNPGIDFGGGLVLPLNFDIYFGLTLNKPGLSAFGNYNGTLDSFGQASATFTLPVLMDPSLVGVTIHHAYLAGSVFGIPEFASNAVSVELVP